MLHSHRPVRVPARRLVTLAYALAAASLGCHSYYPTTGAGDLGHEAMIDVRLGSQNEVVIIRPNGDSIRQPDLQRLRGRVLAVRGDTVTMQVAKLVVRTGGSGSPAVAPGTTARLVLTPDDAVKVEHVSVPKTTLVAVVGGLAIGFVVLIALALSVASPGL